MGITLLERQALCMFGKGHGKASLTREKLLSNVREFSRFLHTKYGLEKIDNIKSKMVEAYVKDLHARGLSASTMAGKMTAVRAVASAIHKQNIVARENKVYGIERIRINPQIVNPEKVSEIRAEIQARADAGDKIAHMCLAAESLRAAFGLRAKESLMSSKIIQEKDGTRYLQIEGAKGGRPREHLVKTEPQCRAVQLIIETSKAVGSATGRIIPPSLSLRQAYDAQRNLWRALGGTRNIGANMHGERHSYARDRHKSGASNRQLMIDLGHGGDRSPSSYLPK